MLSVMITGSAFFPGLFVTLKTWLLRRQGWQEGDAVIMSARLVSIMQSLLASASGVLITTYCHRDVLHARHWLATWYVWFATPYFAYDIVAMFLSHRHRRRSQVDVRPETHPGAGVVGTSLREFLRREALMVTHHVGVCLLCFPTSAFWRAGVGDFFQGCMFLAELSTPFVCLGKILLQFKQQGSLLFKINGLIMIATFFCFRILIFPYMYWAYGQREGLSFWAVPGTLPVVNNIAAALLVAPQLYWLFLICRTAVSRKGHGFRGFAVSRRANNGPSELTKPSPEGKEAAD
uniref:TLC domain containing 3B n=1 Tax=Eptatretus burgeri TaxID=7764 RepID=A0A8C4QG85_EPTBU